MFTTRRPRLRPLRWLAKAALFTVLLYALLSDRAVSLWPILFVAFAAGYVVQGWLGRTRRRPALRSRWLRRLGKAAWLAMLLYALLASRAVLLVPLLPAAIAGGYALRGWSNRARGSRRGTGDRTPHAPRPARRHRGLLAALAGSTAFRGWRDLTRGPRRRKATGRRSAPHGR